MAKTHVKLVAPTTEKRAGAPQRRSNKVLRQQEHLTETEVRDPIAAGTLRCECPDEVIVFGEAHLRRILSVYADYYNQARTQLALQKDTPLRRAIQRAGSVVAIPIHWAVSPICPNMNVGNDRIQFGWNML